MRLGLWVACGIIALAQSQPSCPSDAQKTPLTYTGTNLCGQGPSTTGVGILESSSSPYSVASFYFGSMG